MDGAKGGEDQDEMEDDELIVHDEGTAEIDSATKMIQYAKEKGWGDVAATTPKELDALLLKN